jgi:hypothetical protein
VATSHPPLLSGLGTLGAHWEPRPPEDATVQAAWEWISHAVNLSLARAGITANDLSGALGDTPAAWRHKLSGRRLWQIDDLLGLALAFNIFPPDPLWRPGAINRDLLPEPYRALLSQPVAGRIPRLRATVPWDRVATHMADWLTDAAGTGWVSTVVAATATRALLDYLDALGLRLGSVIVTSDWEAPRPIADAWWPDADTRVLLCWAAPFATPPSDQPSMRPIADLMFTGDPSTAAAVTTVLLAPEPVVTHLARAVSQGAAGVLAQSEAKAIGLTTEGSPSGRTVELLASKGPCLVVQVR